MKIFWTLVIILVVFFTCTSTSAAQTSIIGEQPLSKIAIHKAVYALSDSSSIKAYPSLLGFKGEDTQWVNVDLDHIEPYEDDWVGVFSPSKFNGSTCYFENDPKEQIPYICSAPIKYKYANYSNSNYTKTGRASIKFQLINQRADFSFALFSGGLSNPKLVAISNPITFANPKVPLYPRLAQGKSWDEMTVTWTSGYNIDEAVAFVEWGMKGHLKRLSPAGTLTFHQNSMCGSPARTVGWRDPGFIHTSFLKDLWPNTMYTYRMGHILFDGSYIWSKTYSFKSSPYPGQNSLQQIIIFGDMGKAERDGSNEYSNYQPGSLNTTDQLIKDLKNIDIVFHIGDLAYANGYISQWDQFTSQVEPIASTVPYMVASGNHERDWPGTGSFYDTVDSGGECGVLAETMFYVPAENRAKFWQSASGQLYGAYNQDDVDALRALAEEPGIIYIFLTNEWPSWILNRVPPSDAPPGISDLSGSDSTISELVAEMKPRYHIAGTKGTFYAREPYVNIDAVHVTCFLGLAPVGNPDKQKFIHAISPTPASAMSAAEISLKPPNTTSNPYASLDKPAHTGENAKRSSDSVSDSQYWRYDVSQKRQRHGDGDRLCFKFISSGSCTRGEQCHFRHDVDAREQSLRGVCFDFMNKGKCERGPDCNFKHNLQEEGESGSNRRPGSGKGNTDRSKECWFCLSSPNVESHLITSIGEHCYCALAKGPLIPDHVLILPVEHLPNTLSSPPECEIELVRFQNSLRAYFKNQAKEVVFFEWVYIRATHANLQAIPIPSSRESSVLEIFNLAAERMGFKFVVLKSGISSEGRNLLRTQFDRKCSLFYVELPGGTILSHAIEESEKFPAQFGREVLAGLLNMADRADWRNCKLSKGEEIKMAENFKNGFEKFDPNR